jgi:hypothetical protein
MKRHDLGSETDVFYPDGLTREVIDALLSEARADWDKPGRATTALLDGSAAQRRERRAARRAFGAVVRALPSHSVRTIPDGEVA